MKPMTAARRPAALFLFVLVLCAAGIWTALRLPSSIFPAVTRPLEEAILRVPGIERVTSTTARGSVEIGAEFSWGTDMQIALQRVQAQVERVRPDLLPDTRIQAEWMNTAVFPILGYALTSDTRSQSDLRELAEFQVKPELIRIPGVSEVQVQGGRVREFQIRLDPDRLTAHKVSAAEVVDAIQKNNLVKGAGLAEGNHELYLSLVTGMPAGIDELSRISVPSPHGEVPVSLGQLGTIASADAVSYIRTAADLRPAVLINVIRQPSASTLEIAAGVADYLETHSATRSSSAWASPPWCCSSISATGVSR